MTLSVKNFLFHAIYFIMKHDIPKFSKNKFKGALMQKFLLIIVGSLFLFSIFYFVANSVNQEEIHDIQKISIEDIQNLHVYSDIADIEVVPTSDLKLRAKLEGKMNSSLAKKLAYTVEKQGDTLKVEVTHKEALRYAFFNILHSKLKLTIAVPEKEWKELYVENTANQMIVEGIYGNHLQFKQTSGNMKVQDLQAQNVAISTTSGVIQAQNIISDQQSVRLTSGDVSLEQIETDDLRMKATSGTQRLVDVQAKKMTAELTSGDIQVKQLLGEEATLKLTSGTADVTMATPLQKMLINGTSGDVRIHYTELVRDLRYTHEETSGDVVVDLTNGENSKGASIVGAGQKQLTTKFTSGTFYVSDTKDGGK